MMLLRHRRIAAPRRAFTLIELLVVLLIIGLVSAISIPALKGIGQSNTMTSATRQLLDDLSLARHKAISGRTTVHVVFVPDWQLYSGYDRPGAGSKADDDLFERLKAGCQTSYALYAERTAGDQPGQRTDRYLTKWRSLPDGVFIASPEFADVPNAWDQPFQFTSLPFPTARSIKQDRVPHVAFNENGNLVDLAGRPKFQDEYIHLTKGSILPEYDPAGNVTALDVREIPQGNWHTNYNRIHIDAITGRAKLQQPQITQ
jgi:prepilin-type N-terminal cleavage/methylation domain-containing protein